MKLKLLLLLALASGARAVTQVGDRIVVPPFATSESATFVGTVTLSQPGRYAAACWNIVGQLRFAAPGAYVLEATAGGVTIAGQLIGATGPATVHVKYPSGSHFVAASVATNITLIDDAAAMNGLPEALRMYAVAVGERVVLSAPVAPGSRCQWHRNGDSIAGATQSLLELPAVQIADAGVYTLAVTGPEGERMHLGGVVAIRSATKVMGDAREVAADVIQPNGSRYDQFLLTGGSATIRADAGQVARISFIDLTDDIVQVELSGAGSLTVVLADASGPALPAKYSQSIRYMKGHATLLVADADATTNLSVFSVGRANAQNPRMFHEGVAYDGIADIAALTVVSPAGQCGGLFMGNAHLFTNSGIVGVFAPGVAFAGPVRLGNISAYESAVPMLVFGRAAEVQVTGGDFRQENGCAVQVQGIGRVSFVAGARSDGALLMVQVNQATLVCGGLDVTSGLLGP